MTRRETKTPAGNGGGGSSLMELSQRDAAQLEGLAAIFRELTAGLREQHQEATGTFAKLNEEMKRQVDERTVILARRLAGK